MEIWLYATALVALPVLAWLTWRVAGARIDLAAKEAAARVEREGLRRVENALELAVMDAALRLLGDARFRETVVACVVDRAVPVALVEARRKLENDCILAVQDKMAAINWTPIMDRVVDDAASKILAGMDLNGRPVGALLEYKAVDMAKTIVAERDLAESDSVENEER